MMTDVDAIKSVIADGLAEMDFSGGTTAVFFCVTVIQPEGVQTLVGSFPDADAHPGVADALATIVIDELRDWRGRVKERTNARQ